MYPLRTRGVRAFLATVSIGAALFVGPTPAQAADSEEMLFLGYSSISFDDATDRAYSAAMEWGYTYCPRTRNAHMWGDPPTYSVELVCYP